jgi:hypothetical protein
MNIPIVILLLINLANLYTHVYDNRMASFNIGEKFGLCPVLVLLINIIDIIQPPILVNEFGRIFREFS